MEKSPTEPQPAQDHGGHETRRCGVHGEYEAHQYWRDRWSICPTCRAEEMKAEAAAAKRADVEAKRQERVRRSGLRGRFLQTTFASYHAATPKQASALQTCRQAVATFQPDAWAPLWLIGPPGTGKTHLLAGMVMGVIDRGFSAEIVTPRQAIAQLRDTWRRDSRETERDVVEAFASCDLLAIDEVGIGFGTEAELTQLFDVIDLRYQLQRNVIIASNLPPKELHQAIGSRLNDRLRENARVVLCNWPSHRTAGPG